MSIRKSRDAEGPQRTITLPADIEIEQHLYASAGERKARVRFTFDPPRGLTEGPSEPNDLYFEKSGERTKSIEVKTPVTSHPEPSRSSLRLVLGPGRHVTIATLWILVAGSGTGPDFIDSITLSLG
jgi:hypothetical protein